MGRGQGVVADTGVSSHVLNPTPMSEDQERIKICDMMCMVNSDYSCDINKDIHDHKIVLRIAKFRLSSPRLELGISRVSGGRIDQLSHEDECSSTC